MQRVRPGDECGRYARRGRTPMRLGARVLGTTQAQMRRVAGHTLRVHIERRRSRAPGHRSGQKFVNERRFDRGFLQNFELDENFPINESCSVKYPLQLLQRPS
jgi:hypothetical protein